LQFKLKRELVNDFNVLKCIYKITGVIENLTPLRIGAGGFEKGEILGSPADLTVLRLGGRPYIPGSSLKGVFRSHVENIAALKYGVENVHSPFDDIREKEKDEVCAVCGIFGNTTLASHITIFNSQIQGEPTYHYKPGVGISRKLGSVAQGPFIEEYVEPGHKWSFEVHIINIDIEHDDEDPRVFLLKSLLRDLENGVIQIGGRKSIGAGLIKLLDTQLKIHKTHQQNGELKYNDEVNKPW